MTAERFLELVQAWGADRRRWPTSERVAAEAFAAAHPDIAGPALAEADEVDALLFASATPRVSTDLRDRVIAAAAASGRTGRRWMGRLTLAFGAGWAAAACAGVVAGIARTSHLTADARADAVFFQATLTGVDDAEVLG